jgi:hypothetical protein
MRGPKLIILALVAVTAAVFIVFFERHQPTSEERRQRADRVFPGLETDEVVAVDLATGHGPVSLRRGDDGGWRLEAPVEFVADEVSVRSLLRSLEALEAERELPLAETSLADHGLEEPALSAVMVDADGRRFELEVGEATPLGDRRAVRRDGGDEVIITTGAFVANLDRELDHWRSREVVDVLENELAAIEIDAGDDRIHAVRVDGRWQLLAPLEDLAGTRQISSLVSELDTLRVSEFLPADADPAALGLDRPEYEVLLIRADGTDPTTLELAAPSPDSSPGTVVCRRDGDAIFTVPDSIRTRLAKAPVLWRSSEVWPFETWDVERLEIAGDGAAIAVERTDLGWQVAGGGEADEVEVRRRLGALAELEAAEYDLLLPPTPVLGSVTLGLEGDDAGPVVYTFYAPLEEGGHAVVKVSARDTVMGVKAAPVESIVGDPGALRSPVAESPATGE